MDEREAYAQELERRYRHKTRPVKHLDTGETFQSAAAMADAFAVSSVTVHTWIKAGKVEYVGEKQ